jgi:hypothetical protein
MGRSLLLVGFAVSTVVCGWSAGAWASSYPNGGTTPTTVRVDAQTAVAPATATVTQAPSGSTLPFTGSDVATLAGSGVVAIGVGTLLTRRSRRKA